MEKKNDDMENIYKALSAAEYNCSSMAKNKEHSIRKKNIWKEITTAFDAVKSVPMSIGTPKICSKKNFKRKPLTSNSINASAVKSKHSEGCLAHFVWGKTNKNERREISSKTGSENSSVHMDFRQIKQSNNVEESTSELDLLIMDLGKDVYKVTTPRKRVKRNGFLSKYHAALKKAELNIKFSKIDCYKGIVKGVSTTVLKTEIDYGVWSSIVKFENGSLARSVANNYVRDVSVGDTYLLDKDKYYFYNVRGVQTFMYLNVIP